MQILPSNEYYFYSYLQVLEFKTIPIPICPEIDSTNQFLFLFAGKITIPWSLIRPVDKSPRLTSFKTLKKNVTHDLWHITCDMWHITCDTWQVTPDTWHVGGGKPSLKIEAR